MRTPTVISLFTGAGGLDYGFEAAGFRTAVALDIDHDSCETIRRNRGWPVIERDLLAVSSDELLEVASSRRGDADVLIGGPPCQPFSKSGYWARGDAQRLNDPRSNTIHGFMRVLSDTRPKAFLLENVEGLSYQGKNEGLRFILDRIAEINKQAGTSYRPVFQVLRAADYGVPQVRERFFMIASRDGELFRFPSPTHRSLEMNEESSLVGDRRPRYRTAWDALGDLASDHLEDLRVRGKWADLLPSIPEGQNYLWHTERGGGAPIFGWRRRYWSFLLKLAKNRPSWTVQAQPGPATGPFHWDNRRLSGRELCRLQTFPDNVTVFGNLAAVQRQVGNAVPSLLAEVLAREIGSQLLGIKRPSGPLKLLPPDRSPAPRPGDVAAVPERYRTLQGAHAPHPGTGKGYRAELWSADEQLART